MTIKGLEQILAMVELTYKQALEIHGWNHIESFAAQRKEAVLAALEHSRRDTDPVWYAFNLVKKVEEYKRILETRIGFYTKKERIADRERELL